MKKALNSILILLALTAIARRGVAQEHPVPLEQKTESSTCLQCHEDKGKGKHVHSAIAMGCTTCHEVKTEKDTTSIALTASKKELCFTCHEKAQDSVKHAPYDQGQCVICHDPHTSDNDKQLRAEGNSVCLECHAERRTTGDTVTLFGKVAVPDDQFQGYPKVLSMRMPTRGHPWEAHPVADIPDPMRPGEKMSCRSCHAVHASGAAKMIRTDEFKNAAQLCDTCHSARDKQRDLQAKRIAEAQAASTATQQKAKPQPGAKSKKDKKE